MLKITSPNEAEDASWLSFPLGLLPLALVEILQILEAFCRGVRAACSPYRARSAHPSRWKEPRRGQKVS